VNRVLLAGIVGSTAYGLSGPDSDVDRLGVFAAPTVAFHGLNRPVESIVTSRPDRTLHEAAKWLRLALHANPTVTELVWLPEDLYEVRTAFGDELIAVRGSLPSAPRVRLAYLGYAAQQFGKLRRRAGRPAVATERTRIAKHARHLKRLCHQGLQLYRTGEVEIRLADPRSFLDFGDRVAAGDLDAAERLLAGTEAGFDAARSPLPAQPDHRPGEDWLLRLRAAHWNTDTGPVGGPIGTEHA
jgi:uncharacterized protein